jgi:hypothetical protein
MADGSKFPNDEENREEQSLRSQSCLEAGRNASFIKMEEHLERVNSG